MRDQKIEAIQLLRGFAALAVVGIHSLAFELKYSGGDLLLPQWFRFGETGVDLFFVISGFVMVTVTRGRFGRAEEVVRFLWGRVTRIYPTYWFYFFVTLSVFLVKPSWVNSSLPVQSNLWASFFLWPHETMPLVVVAWSLIFELWFYIVFAVLLFFPERVLLPFLCAWATVIVAMNLYLVAQQTGVTQPVAVIVTHPYTCEFILGSLAALLLRTAIIARLPTRLYWAILVVVVVAIVQAHVAGALNHGYLTRALVLGVLYAALLASCVVLERRGSLRIPALLRLNGDMSYTVYLSHLLVLSVIGKIWFAIGPVSGLWDNFVACTIMYTAVLVYGWVGYRLIERPAVEYSHRLRARLIELRRPARTTADSA